MRTLLFSIAILLTFSNCVRTKKMIYMQDLKKSEAVLGSSKLVPYEVQEYRMQINDVVDVSIRTTSKELNELLTENNSRSQARNFDGINSGDIFFLSGYTIDADGLVDLPLIGELRLVGLNIKEAKEIIERRLENYVTEGNYYVRVRLGGVRYAALGEFGDPGKFTVLQNRVTIFEAIANAGEMTTVANRAEVLIIRQYPEGARTHTINLLSDEIMSSEFFFIKPNDVIYARPLKAKQWGTGVTFAQTFELLLTAITFVLLITR